jgi:hypothetical protein
MVLAFGVLGFVPSHFAVDYCQDICVKDISF